MDLKQLQAMGAIEHRPLVPKKIPVKYPVPNDPATWADPEVAEYPDTPEFKDGIFDTHIRKRSSADFIELTSAPNREKPFVAIFRCVCNPDGSQLFETMDQVLGLKEWLWIPLMTAVNEVNQFGPKNSRPRTNSGMNSPSSSAARLRKRSSASRKKSGPAGSPTEHSAAP